MVGGRLQQYRGLQGGRASTLRCCCASAAYCKRALTRTRQPELFAALTVSRCMDVAIMTFQVLASLASITCMMFLSPVHAAWRAATKHRNSWRVLFYTHKEFGLQHELKFNSVVDHRVSSAEHHAASWCPGLLHMLATFVRYFSTTAYRSRILFQRRALGRI